MFGWGEKGEDEKRNEFLPLLGVKIDRTDNGMWGNFHSGPSFFFFPKWRENWENWLEQ